MNPKSFAILNKIKSLVKKTGSSWIRRKRESDISEKIAIKIQKNAYDMSLIKSKDSFTSPYLLIAEQLQVEDDQIFRAAVYNIAQIAMNDAKLTKPILSILNKYTTEHTKTPAQQEYVKRKIEEINKAAQFKE